jgi:hypothetical protein
LTRRLNEIKEKGESNNFFWVFVKVVIVMTMVMHLGGTLDLAPTLLETTAGHIASTVSHGAGAAVGGGTAGGVLAAEAAAGVVAVHHVAGAATADVVNGGGTAEVALEFLVEAEDGALAGAVNVAGTAAAGGEG